MNQGIIYPIHRGGGVHRVHLPQSFHTLPPCADPNSRQSVLSILILLNATIMKIFTIVDTYFKAKITAFPEVPLVG